jgi:hypothetical protein
MAKNQFFDILISKGVLMKECQKRSVRKDIFWNGINQYVKKPPPFWYYH